MQEHFKFKADEVAQPAINHLYRYAQRVLQRMC